MEIEPTPIDIHPPAYKPTEQEHKIAHLKRCLTDICYNHLLMVYMCRRGDLDGASWLEQTPAEISDDRLGDLLEQLFGDSTLKRPEAKQERGVSPWERMRPYEDFKQSCLEDLAAPHCGDCTAFPASCSRCWAEDLYDVPSTVKWYKTDGFRLVREYEEGQK